MSGITEQARRESHEKVDKRKRQQMILNAWTGSMTAREILERLIVMEKLPHTADMNAVRPRITELAHMGVLKECGRKYDEFTERLVTCWRKV